MSHQPLRSTYKKLFLFYRPLTKPKFLHKSYEALIFYTALTKEKNPKKFTQLQRSPKIYRLLTKRKKIKNFPPKKYTSPYEAIFLNFKKY